MTATPKISKIALLELELLQEKLELLKSKESTIEVIWALEAMGLNDIAKSIRSTIELIPD
jgi:hypothetical protein